MKISNFLLFFRQELQLLKISQISSIGCGCGTLEWLIQAATDIQVTGYEVNKTWWEGPHSTPHFIQLEFVNENGLKCIIEPNSALMFCYFNNIEFFHAYLKNYTGECVILIGPIDGKRHCEPGPDYLEKFAEFWFVKARMEISGGDEICVYQRLKSQIEIEEK